MVKLLYIASVLVLLSVVSAQNSLQTVNGRIHMKVGVTSACPDAARFITTQLRQTYDLYKQFLDIDIVPWGRTIRDGAGNPVCQFGVNDCWANRAQRCVLSLLPNLDAKIDYMECEFSPPIPAFNLKSLQCAQALGVNLIDVDNCITSTQGDVLDAQAEAVSVEAIQVINFIPFIVFNDNINYSQFVDGYLRLESTICFALADDPSTGVTSCRI